MAKYDPLKKFLASQSSAEISMTFAEIERAIGNSLPPSASEHRPWWANEARGHVHAKAWLNAGYETTQVDMAAKRLVFKRIVPAAKAGGMAEAAREFKPAEDIGEKRQNHHPALGAMKGMFTIEPGYDLTRPMYSDEEWREIEKEMSEDWDQIERGMTGGNK